MTRRALSGAVLALAFLLGACRPDAEAEVFRSEDFSIVVPPGWTALADRYGVALSLHPPEGQSRLVHVTVAVDPHRPRNVGGEAPPTLERYARMKLERAGFLGAPAQVLALDDGEQGGVPVVRARRSYNSGPIRYESLVLFALGPDATGYTVTGAAPAEGYRSVAAELAVIVESFRLTQP